jgi:hypothetical protein
MRLDHVSYVASHDQISDVVNRIGSQIGTAFVDGGIHPKFGTRNFTAPLLNGQYIEVVCPLDHPATDTTPFGKAVKKKSLTGGGWLAWVIATDNIKKIGEIYGREPVQGFRRKPNGAVLEWYQLGVTDSSEDSRKPFYVEWISKEHPSSDGAARAKISEILMIGEDEAQPTFLSDIFVSEFNLRFSKSDEGARGIKEVTFHYNNQIVIID